MLVTASSLESIPVSVPVAERLQSQSPQDIVKSAQQLLCEPDRGPEWRARAVCEIDLLQHLIQEERRWLQTPSQTQSKRHLNELINDTMTCLLSLEFAVLALQPAG